MYKYVKKIIGLIAALPRILALSSMVSELTLWMLVLLNLTSLFLLVILSKFILDMV